ncbi:MAG: hypothetical protein WD993_10340 [Thermoleophilaceae bacterium]
MAKVLAALVGAIVVVGVVSQLVVPGFVERSVESSLKEDDPGGNAVVDVRSFPAVRLLWGSGDRFEARGRGVRVDLGERIEDPLGKLERFDEVDIYLEDLAAGPVDVRAFSLVKTEQDDSYTLRMQAVTTPLALAESVGGDLGGEIGRLIASAATSTLPDGGQTDIPIGIDGPVRRSDDGTVDADAVRASVAGVPAGPLAEAIVQAVVERM